MAQSHGADLLILLSWVVTSEVQLQRSEAISGGLGRLIQAGGHGVRGQQGAQVGCSWESGSGSGRPGTSIISPCTLEQAGSSLWVTFLHLRPWSHKRSLSHRGLVIRPLLHHGVTCPHINLME